MSHETVFTISGRAIKFQKFVDRHIDEPLPLPTIHERCPSHGDEQDERPISTNQAMYDAGHKASDFS